MSERTRELACTAFRLRKAARRVSQTYEAALDASGVSIVQFAVLAELSRSSARTLSVLADLLATDRTTLSRTIDRMQALGWVSDCESADRRERRLILTSAGETAYQRAIPAWQRVECTIGRTLGTERRNQLWSLLEELEDGLAEAEARPCEAKAVPVRAASAD
ncbi:MarR family winged helix-turn-helix transcriptional regulator [Amorphus sp. MBR-141]